MKAHAAQINQLKDTQLQMQALFKKVTDRQKRHFRDQKQQKTAFYRTMRLDRIDRSQKQKIQTQKVISVETAKNQL